MGIDTGCSLIVGLPYEELNAGLSEDLKQKIDESDWGDVIGEDGELGLESASPFYDSAYDDRVWGIVLFSEYWGACEIPIEILIEKAEAAKAEFKEKTGMDAKLFISPNVT